MRPRPLTLHCPRCALRIVSPQVPSDIDAGLVLVDHVRLAHPEVVYSPAEAARRRLEAQVNARLN